MPRIALVFSILITTASLRMFGQCPSPAKVFLPEADKVKFDSYGAQQDTYGSYLVVAARYNDSLAVNGGIVYLYKVGVDQKWIKIAELVPSDPQRQAFFGYQVSISGSSIAVRGIAYDDNGAHYNKIYIYEKPVGGEWSSGIETYQISISNSANWIADFDLHEDELVANVAMNGKVQISVYQKLSGVFELVQQIDLPFDKKNNRDFGRIAVANGLIAVAATRYNSIDNTIGAVFLYEKNNGLYSVSPDAKLTPSNLADLYIGFGITLAIYNDAVFVGASDRPDPVTYKQAVYIFEKPLTGWADTNETAIIVSEEWIPHSHELEVNNDYILISGSSWSHVRAYKKMSASWASGFQTFKIDNPLQETVFFGYQVSTTADHLVISAPDNYGDFEGTSEAVVSYFLPNGDWENIFIHHQVLMETTVNASGDEFGSDLSAYQNFLAISAPEDSEVKPNSGAVYIFDINKDPGVFSKVLPVNPQKGSPGFGHAVALRDSVLFVSAVYEDSLQADGTRLFQDMGKVYIYRLSASGWKYHSYIVSPLVKAKSHFGQDIACSKGYVAVTEYYRFSGTNDFGRVHIYKEDANGFYNFLATLRPAQDIKDAFFGKNILLNDSMVVIANRSSTGYRKVFIYNKKGEWSNATEDAWIETTSNINVGSIAMDEDHIVIGDYVDQAVHIFAKPLNGWIGSVNKVAQLSNSVYNGWEHFGYSVAIYHDHIYVGAPHSIIMKNYTDYFTNNDNSIKPGTVYVYHRSGTTWSSTSKEDQLLQSQQPEWLDGFGSSLLVTDDKLIISSVYGNTSAGLQSGSVQTFLLSPGIRPIENPICVADLPITLVGYPAGGVWSGAGIENPESPLFDPSLLDTGSYPVTYTTNGCTDTIDLQVINPQINVIDVSANQQLKCIDAPVSLFLKSDIAPENYFWFFQTQGQYSKIDSMKNQVLVKQPGSYYVEIDHPHCQSHFEFFTVTNEDAIEIAIEEPEPICSDEQVKLLAMPAGGTWIGTIVSEDGVIEPHGVPVNTYPVVYSLITVLGCEYKKEISVTIDLLREPVVVQTTDKICSGGAVTLEVDAGDDQSVVVNWFREGDGSVLSTDRELSTGNAGDYFVVVSKHTCSFQTQLIHVTEERDSLYVPNVFTPNNDSHNDYFQVVSSGLFDFQLRILNRYGKSIYRTRDENFLWTGEGHDSGVYFWVAQYRTCDNKVSEHKGWVHLIR